MLLVQIGLYDPNLSCTQENNSSSHLFSSLCVPSTGQRVYVCELVRSSQESSETHTVIITISQTRKLRHREAKSLAEVTQLESGLPGMHVRASLLLPSPPSGPAPAQQNLLPALLFQSQRWLCTDLSNTLSLDRLTVLQKSWVSRVRGSVNSHRTSIHSANVC